MPPDRDLLEHLPTYLPAFVGSETLYSWCARYHRLSGNGIATDSCIQLFGRGTPGLKHDFPTQLNVFCQRTHDALGKPEALALARTLLGYYAPFASSNAYRRALEAVTGIHSGNPKHILGLMASRVGAAHPLKACPACAQQDIKDSGHSRWILEHQWPSVWICRKHGIPLRSLIKAYQPRDLRHWTLPEDHKAREWADTWDTRSTPIDLLLAIASISASLAGTPLMFEEDRLRLTYRIGAKERGWIALDGTLRLATMLKNFQHTFGRLAIIPGFSFLTDADANSGGVIGLLTRHLRGLHHPSKHATLIAFLFQSVDAFLDTYRATDRADLSDEVSMLSGELRGQLRYLVESEHYSVSQAATLLDLPVSQACRWLDAAGAAYERRPRVLNDEKRARITAMLQAGDDYQTIADQVGVKKGLVRAFAAANLELRNLWKQRRFERLRDAHRERACMLFEEHRGASMKALRSVSGNGVAWLARHDRDWLRRQAPNLLAPAVDQTGPAAYDLQQTSSR